MKKLIAAALVGTMVLTMAGCGSKQAASTDGGSKTESEAGSDAAAADSGEKKTLRVGMECAYAPYNWTQSDDSNGAVPISGSSDYAYGYDVMMAKHICEELGWDLEKLLIMTLQAMAESEDTINAEMEAENA